MKRREFISGLGAAAAWPLAARAEQAEMPVIGFLHAGSSADRGRAVVAFQQGLAEADYIENQNVAFEFRWADGQFDRLPGMATDLADRKVAIIAAFGNAAARAAKAATTTIPVVFASSSDPTAIGLVTSLNRPGGNVTGVSILNQELESTRLERLVEVVPRATTIAFLVNPESLTADPKLREMESAARMLNRRLQVLNARSEREFEQVFATVEQQQIGAMVVTSDTMFSNESATLGRASARHTVPTMGAYRDFTRAGGLMSYGSDLHDAYRRVGACAARILKGETPSEVPVTQSTKVEFVINLKTANALGLKIPPQLLAIANEVIE
ncbi:MAG TPA: ABC transporter substrate-binding protein [Pseudomonadota bacterium]|nr:ABC transporter substrate-binding protein [Pseudomonadota bacterium]